MSVASTRSRRNEDQKSALLKRNRRALTPVQDRDEEAQHLSDDDYEDYKILREQSSQKHLAKFLANKDQSKSSPKKRLTNLRGQGTKPPSFDDDDEQSTRDLSPPPKTSGQSSIRSANSTEIGERIKSQARSRIGKREAVSLKFLIILFYFAYYMPIIL